ncbi:MAG: GNAT family N-acetyltransferase [Solirubrobacterales bacterium]|nr:GNAT family N-acetyltransferase [Solirubrobacterales bacterium]
MRFRAPVPDDAPAVLAVFTARDIADLGVVEHRLEELLDEWRGSDLDLDHNAQVVQDESGRIVAYAAVRRWPGSLVVVHPESEGRGIGSRLLVWTEGRERAVGRGLHRQWVAAGNASARALLTSASYERARSYWQMTCWLKGAGPEPRVPSGFRLRTVNVARDAAAMQAIDAASFATTPDYMPESLAEFIERNLRVHGFDAGLSRVATERDQIVGFLLANRQEKEGVGYISILAVEPGHQRKGLGTTMLRSAFAAFAAAGLGEAQLGVASYNDRALRVYERVGMTVRHQFDIYERPIDN